MSLAIEVAVETEDWAFLDSPSRLARAAILAAVEESGVVLAANAEVSVLFCHDSFIRELNRKWRGIDKPTNVLSFPGEGDPALASLLGDIVIAFETASREASEEGKLLHDHLTHLLVHGFLHLIGHDHVEASEAEAMEALERAILARLGIDDPYRASSIQEVVGAHE